MSNQAMLPVLASIAAAISFTSISRAAVTTQPASDVIFVGGDVERPGAYQMAGREPTVLTAIDWAGVDQKLDYEIIVTHRLPNRSELMVNFTSLKLLRQSPEASFALRPRDIVYVTPAAEQGGPALAPGDLLSIRIPDFGAPQTDAIIQEHVAADGSVPVVLVGDVPVGGKDPADAAKAIDKAFADAKLISHPHITVKLVQTGGKPLPISIGDRVTVRMWDILGPGKLTQYDAVVAADGTINIPLMKRAKIDGMTESEAMESLVKLYKDAGLIMHLPVAVTRLDATDTAKSKSN